MRKILWIITLCLFILAIIFAMMVIYSQTNVFYSLFYQNCGETDKPVCGQDRAKRGDNGGVYAIMIMPRTFKNECELYKQGAIFIHYGPCTQDN